MNKRILSVFVLLVLVALAFSVQAQDSDPQSPVAEPLGPQFTYQGQLKNETGVPINDACDLTFGLWDAASGGAQVGADNVVTGVVVTEGTLRPFSTPPLNSAIAPSTVKPAGWKRPCAAPPAAANTPRCRRASR